MRKLIFAAALGLLTLAGWYAYYSKQKLSAKLTAGRMLMLADIVRAREPNSVDQDTLRLLVAGETGGLDNLLDGWGHPLIVERLSTQPPGYKIVSQGRDGKRGASGAQFFRASGTKMLS